MSDESGETREEAALALLKRWRERGFPMGAALLWDDTITFLDRTAVETSNVRRVEMSNGEAGMVLTEEVWLVVRSDRGALMRIPRNGSTMCGSNIEYGITLPAISPPTDATSNGHRRDQDADQRAALEGSPASTDASDEPKATLQLEAAAFLKDWCISSGATTVLLPKLVELLFHAWCMGTNARSQVPKATP